jgi:hypothetical protein
MLDIPKAPDRNFHLTQNYSVSDVKSNNFYAENNLQEQFNFQPIRCATKAPIVFIHDKFRFEIWLSGSNRNVQQKCWKELTESGWKTYHLASNPQSVDYILDHVLIEDPDFGDLDTLTRQIEQGALGFIKDVEGFLSSHVR